MMAKRLTVCGFISAALILAAMSAFFVQVTAKEIDGTDMDYTDEDTASVMVNDEISEELAETDVPDEIIIDDAHCETDVHAPHHTEHHVHEYDHESSLELRCPLAEHSGITGKFGEQTSPIGAVIFNNGVNVAADKGSAVYASASGTVTKAEYNHTSGNCIVIDHGDGCQTVYRHLEKMYCKAGDEVQSGCEIGTVGATGMVTGPNLGFSIIQDGAYVSPEGLFR